MKKRNKPPLKQRLKLWLRLILNWRFLICFGIAWLITNGWSYLLFGLGLLLKNEWLLGISGAYLAFLWLPISPEKVVTCAIALFLVRRLFPRHNQALQKEILLATGQESTSDPSRSEPENNP